MLNMRPYYEPLLSDTSIDVDRLVHAHMAALSPAEKLRRMLGLIALGRHLMARDIEERNPGLSADEIKEEMVARLRLLIQANGDQFE